MSNRLGPRVGELLDRYRQVYGLHCSVLDTVSTLRESFAKGNDLTELADISALLSRIEQVSEEQRKVVAALRGQVDRHTCTVFTLAHANDPENAGNLKGVFSTATPDVAVVPVIPSRTKEPEQYEALLNELGVKASDEAKSTLSFHFPSLAEYCSKLQEQGKPFPSSLKKTYTTYKLVHYTRSGADPLSDEEIDERIEIVNPSYVNRD